VEVAELAGIVPHLLLELREVALEVLVIFLQAVLAELVQVHLLAQVVVEQGFLEMVVTHLG
jgi:hypothetical protein